MEDNRIPVTVLTGFLGSGKTTVLNHLLKDPRLADTAVIVNEFGEIGLDHLLVEKAVDEMVLLDNGCLCCSVRGDLVDTLKTLTDRVSAGEIPSFARVMVETTGLADPAPIAQTLMKGEGIAERFRFKAVVATVDGVNGVETLDAYSEARSQVAMADLMLMTKTDSPEANAAAVRDCVRRFNPSVPMETTINGQIDPGIVLGIEGTGSVSVPNQHSHGHAGHAHEGNIDSVSIILDRPLPWNALAGWLDWITALRGPDILRIKGLVSVQGIDGPVLFHGVQHVFSPPIELADWPDEDHRSRLVVIARDCPATALRQSLDTFLACHNVEDGVQNGMANKTSHRPSDVGSATSSGSAI